MRIGLVIYGNLDTVSGGYLYDRMLVEHLRGQGDTVEIISIPWRDYSRHLADNFSPTLLQQLREVNVNILLQDELNHPSLFWLNRRLKHHVSYPRVSIVHHLRCNEDRPGWQNLFYRQIERPYLTGVDGFIFNSHTTRQAVARLTGDLPPSVVAYPAGNRLQPRLTPDQITTRAQQPGPLQLCFIGNLILRKGLHTLLTALARLPHTNWQLHVIGSLTVDPAYARTIQHQIESTGLTRQVTLYGSIADAELAALLAKSDLLAVPSTYEGFGIVYLEGMSFGLPAIATTAGAAHEIITHGQNGFLIAPNDSITLAEHIYQLSRNREQLLTMSLSARQRYEQYPTWQQSAAQIRQFLLRWMN